MNHKHLFGIIVSGLLLFCVGIFALYGASVRHAMAPGPDVIGGQVCDADAKICPDGSSVGRTGPNCSFAECPGTSAGTTGRIGSTVAKGDVTGLVDVSPTCPVERVPPEPGCAPRPYSTTIEIYRQESMVLAGTVKSDKSGRFMVSLAPGAYTLHPIAAEVLPSCMDVMITVTAGQATEAHISCDSGIR